jgi:opacity protein-like surface antigen
MNSKLLTAVFIAVLFSLNHAAAQNTRITNKNTIGWFNYFGTIKLNQKWSLHTEYQWRRNELVTDWQQSLLRTGINYQVNPNVQLRAGYAWIETFAYGEIPLNNFGKQFTEHRAYQMVTVTDKLSSVDLSHRFMLEQRWVGRYSRADLKREDDYVFTNRLRYMFRMQVPLKGKTMADKTPYAAVYDEVFIGFGKNVNENVFDQNRIGVMLGYRFNKTFRVEGGFLNQTLQLGREVNGRNIFQYNNGLIINTYLNL